MKALAKGVRVLRWINPLLMVMMKMVVMAVKKLVVNLMMVIMGENNGVEGGTYGVGGSQQGGAAMSWDSNYYATQDTDH